MVYQYEEDDDYASEFVEEYVRIHLLADFYDGDETHPEIEEIFGAYEDGLHIIEFDSKGKQIYYGSSENNAKDKESFFDENYLDYEEDTEIVYEDLINNRKEDEIYEWQEEALNSWEKNGHKGIIEAVTGSGKTFLGILAAARALDEGFGVVVVVPTIVLQEQWIDELNFFFAEDEDYEAKCVGGIGGNYGSDTKKGASFPEEGRIVVAVAATFSKRFDLHPHPTARMLLIADEVHRYSGETLSQIFDQNIERRMGLTATFEPVSGRYSVYDNYFSMSPLYEYSFRRAIADKVISEFETILIRVEMPSTLHHKYEIIWDKIQDIEYRLKDKFNLTFSISQIHREISSLKEREPNNQDINEWESLNDELDNILSDISTKEGAIKRLSRFIDKRGFTIIFSDFVSISEEVQRILLYNRVYSKIIDSKVKSSERTEALELFSDGRIRCLVSPRVLDEGIDIPLLSFGIFAGVSRRKLQITQRLGRIIRKDENKLFPVICIPVNIGTFEDPLLSGNEKIPHSPLSIILENSKKTHILDASNLTNLDLVLNSVLFKEMEDI